MKEALLGACFVELRAIGETETLVAVAASVGLDRRQVASALAADRFAADVRADKRTAA